MTEPQFREFLKEFKVCFPQTAKWLADCGAGTLAAWFRVLKSRELLDAVEVLYLCLEQGKHETMNSWQDWPSVLNREIVRLLESRKKPSYDTVRNPINKHNITGPRYPDVLRIIREMSPEDARRYIASVYPNSESQVRYKCPLCLDSCIVFCWHIDILRYYQKYDEVNCVNTMAVLCPCNKNNGRFGYGTYDRERVPHYNERGFCRYRHGDKNEVVEWFASRCDPTKNANYNDDLIIIGDDDV